MVWDDRYVGAELSGPQGHNPRLSVQSGADLGRDKQRGPLPPCRSPPNGWLSTFSRSPILSQYFLLRHIVIRMRCGSTYGQGHSGSQVVVARSTLDVWARTHSYGLATDLRKDRGKRTAIGWWLQWNHLPNPSYASTARTHLVITKMPCTTEAWHARSRDGRNDSRAYQVYGRTHKIDDELPFECHGWR